MSNTDFFYTSAPAAVRLVLTFVLSLSVIDVAFSFALKSRFCAPIRYARRSICNPWVLRLRLRLTLTLILRVYVVSKFRFSESRVHTMYSVCAKI